jgi:hypothetical protein
MDPAVQIRLAAPPTGTRHGGPVIAANIVWWKRHEAEPAHAIGVRAGQMQIDTRRAQKPAPE